MTHRTKDIPWLSTLPDDVLAEVRDRLVTHVAFGAGPSFVAGKSEELDPPIALNQALLWFAPYLGSLRGAHIAFVDGGGPWSWRSGFVRFEQEPHEPPSAGVTVVHTKHNA